MTAIAKNTFSDLRIVTCKTDHEWDIWLDKNISSSPEIWLRIYKKDSKITTISYEHAVDIALCYGWIDSQMKRYDDVSYIQKFSPRKPMSNWSKINRQKAEILINEGKMKPTGLLAIENAKRTGKWDQAYK